MKKTMLALGVLLWVVSGLGAQDKKSPYSKREEKPEPRKEEGAKDHEAGGGAEAGMSPEEKRLRELKSLRYFDRYEKALGYIKKNFAGGDWRTIPDLLCGLVFLLDGREEHAADLEKAIAIAKHKILDNRSFNGNWFIAYSALFLTIVYAHEPMEDIKQALEAGFKVAVETRENDTKGWGHNKGWGTSSGYYRRGGAKDLGIVTATMVAAALMARELGVEVPRTLIEGGLQNLASIARNGAVPYGTANGFMGCLSRSAAVFPGLHAAKMSSNPIYSCVSQGLAKDYPNLELGHAYGPIHFFAEAFAGQVLGSYGQMADHWLPQLTSRQNDEGATAMQNDGGRRGKAAPELGATAVYALMILMQKNKLLPPLGRRPAAKGPGGSGGGSPFARVRPKIDDKDLPLGEAPSGPTTGSGQK